MASIVGVIGGNALVGGGGDKWPLVGVISSHLWEGGGGG